MYSQRKQLIREALKIYDVVAKHLHCYSTPYIHLLTNSPCILKESSVSVQRLHHHHSKHRLTDQPTPIHVHVQIHSHPVKLRLQRMHQSTVTLHLSGRVWRAGRKEDIPTTRLNNLLNDLLKTRYQV